MLQKIDAYHKTRQGLAVFALFELLLAYIVFSVAIDSGSILHYIVGFLLLVGVLTNAAKFIRTYGKRQTVNSKKA